MHGGWFYRALGRRRIGTLPSSSRSLVADNKGQTTVEYIVLLSVSVLGCTLLGKSILGGLDTGILKFGGQLERDLKTGRTSVSIWKN